MSVICPFCGKDVNPHDEGAHREVRGWVHGKKADGMALREYTGRAAHGPCIDKEKTGQPPDQESLF